MARLAPLFPKLHGRPRVDDRRVLSGIIFINRNGLRRQDAPVAYGPHKTLYNRWKRWSEKGIFARMMVGLVAEHREEKTVLNEAVSAIGPSDNGDGYDAEWFREALKDKAVSAGNPDRKQRTTPVNYDRRRYKRRNRIEKVFGRLKD